MEPYEPGGLDAVGSSSGLDDVMQRWGHQPDALASVLKGRRIVLELVTGIGVSTVTIGPLGAMVHTPGPADNPDYRVLGSTPEVVRILTGSTPVSDALLSGVLRIESAAPSLATLAEVIRMASPPSPGAAGRRGR
jgi:hypothetical protein